MSNQPPENPEQAQGQHPTQSGQSQNWPQGGYPPDGYQQQPAPRYYNQAPAPQKKSHTLRNVLLVVVLLFVLMIGGCLALFGAAVNEVDKAITEEEQNDIPTEVVEGGAFTHDSYDVESGWSVKRDGIGGVTIKGLRITNTEDTARTALLTFTFYNGNENLAEVECNSNELQADEVSRMDCFSFDGKFPSTFDSVKVADAF